MAESERLAGLQAELRQEEIETAAEAAQKQTDIDDAMQAARLQGTSSMFGDLSSLMNTHSKKAFKIGKIAAIAGATVDGIQAAVSAWASGMKVGGPPAAAAFTAASLIKTGVMIQQIKSQSFGGGGGGASSFSGGIPAVNTQQSPAVSIGITGSEGATFSRDDVIGLIEQMNGAVGDGVSLTATQVA